MTTTRTLTNDELLKLKAVVLYIVNQCQSIDYFHIFKILYFADRDHFAKYGRRIIKDTFCALPNGPVPSVLFDAIKIVAGKKRQKTNSDLRLITDALYSSDDIYSYMLSAKEDTDMDELSLSDIECLNQSIIDNKDIPFKELSFKSHDIAWHDAKNNRQPLSEMSDLMIAKAGGANEAMLEYIKDLELVDSLMS